MAPYAFFLHLICSLQSDVSWQPLPLSHELGHEWGKFTNRSEHKYAKPPYLSKCLSWLHANWRRKARLEQKGAKKSQKLNLLCPTTLSQGEGSLSSGLEYFYFLRQGVVHMETLQVLVANRLHIFLAPWVPALSTHWMRNSSERCPIICIV